MPIALGVVETRQERWRRVYDGAYLWYREHGHPELDCLRLAWVWAERDAGEQYGRRRVERLSLAEVAALLGGAEE